MKKIKGFFSKLFYFLLIPGIVYIIFAAFKPKVFFNGATIYSVALQSCVTVIMAWGISFALTAGNMDFSVAAERVLGAVCGVLLSRKMGIWGLVIGSIGVGMLAGAIKAFLNSAIRVSSMVISVAYCYILGSIGAIVQGNNPMILTSDMCTLGRAPWIWIITAACGAVVYFLEKYSVFGAQCRALGGNEKLSCDSGIKKGKIEGIAILISSFFVGISGILATSYGAGTVAMTGLASMATFFPSVIGFFIGALLQNKINIVFGAISGVITMNVLATGLVSLGIPSQLKDTATGAFLIGLLCFSVVMERKRAESLRRTASALKAKAAA